MWKSPKLELQRSRDGGCDPSLPRYVVHRSQLVRAASGESYRLSRFSAPSTTATYDFDINIG